MKIWVAVDKVSLMVLLRREGRGGGRGVGGCGMNESHVSFEFRNIVDHRSWRRGSEKFSRETKSCAIHHFSCSREYVLLQRCTNTEKH